MRTLRHIWETYILPILLAAWLIAMVYAVFWAMGGM